MDSKGVLDPLREESMVGILTGSFVRYALTFQVRERLPCVIISDSQHRQGGPDDASCTNEKNVIRTTLRPLVQPRTGALKGLFVLDLLRILPDVIEGARPSLTWGIDSTTLP